MSLQHPVQAPRRDHGKEPSAAAPTLTSVLPGRAGTVVWALARVPSRNAKVPGTEVSMTKRCDSTAATSTGAADSAQQHLAGLWNYQAFPRSLLT
jgi:hypothetical protein